MDSHFVLGISEGDNITKKLTKTNKIVIAVILVIVATVSTIFGVKAYNDYQDKQAINSSLSHISNIDKSFTAEGNQAKKLASLKSMENEYSNYKKSQKVFSEVSNKYTDEIAKMKKVFIDGYDAAISKNTLSNIDKITDKSSLNTAKTNLQNELKLITDEKDTVCDTKGLTTYNTKINTVIKAYDARIKSIEDEEAKAAAEAKSSKDAETKAAAEAATKKAGEVKDAQAKSSKDAETKAAAEAATKKAGEVKDAQAKSSSKGSNSKSSRISNGSDKKSANHDRNSYHGSWTEYWSTDKNGKEIPGTRIRHYEDGCVIAPDRKFYTGEQWAALLGLNYHGWTIDAHGNKIPGSDVYK